MYSKGLVSKTLLCLHKMIIQSLYSPTLFLFNSVYGTFAAIFQHIQILRELECNLAQVSGYIFLTFCCIYRYVILSTFQWLGHKSSTYTLSVQLGKTTGKWSFQILRTLSCTCTNLCRILQLSSRCTVSLKGIFMVAQQYHEIRTPQSVEYRKGKKKKVRRIFKKCWGWWMNVRNELFLRHSPNSFNKENFCLRDISYK